jgi:hypothetical protein
MNILARILSMIFFLVLVRTFRRSFINNYWNMRYFIYIGTSHFISYIYFYFTKSFFLCQFLYHVVVSGSSLFTQRKINLLFA